MHVNYDKLMAAGEILMATEDKANPEKLIEVFKVLGNEDKNI
jgi:hypothetical protein